MREDLLYDSQIRNVGLWSCDNTFSCPGFLGPFMSLSRFSFPGMGPIGIASRAEPSRR